MIHKLIGTEIKKDRREFLERIEAGKKASEKKTYIDPKTGTQKKRKWVRCRDGTYKNSEDC